MTPQRHLHMTRVHLNGVQSALEADDLESALSIARDAQTKVSDLITAIDTDRMNRLLMEQGYDCFTIGDRVLMISRDNYRASPRTAILRSIRPHWSRPSDPPGQPDWAEVETEHPMQLYFLPLEDLEPLPQDHPQVVR